MNNHSSLHDALALNFISGVGTVTQRNLINHFGSARAVIDASEGTLKTISGVGKVLAAKILEGKAEAYDRADREIEFARKHQIQIISFSDKRYPRRLSQCVDAPMLIYFRGEADLNEARIVSIVGTRNATQYGKQHTLRLVEELKEYNVLIVSGLAYGIDSVAHKASVKNNIPTVGVLGHGLDKMYPAENRNLAIKMLDNGGLLTEYPSDTKAIPQNFPQRNRIIAGIADVTIVVEAAIKGGALITAEIANNYNRDVCAFPGNVEAMYSAGCNLLIKSHRAHLITGVKDLSYIMNWDKKEETGKPVQVEMNISLTNSEKEIYNLILEGGQLGIDEVSHLSNVRQSNLAIILLGLEMKGLIVTLPGKIYKAL